MSVPASVRRTLSFRFDIDTRVCLDRGVPNLMALAEETNSVFTFFVSMGRSIRRYSQVVSLMRAGSRSTVCSARVKLSAVEKLGLAQFAHTAIVNGRIGARRPDALRALIEHGHEIGLHGGRNHEDWQRHALSWSEQRIQDEITYGLASILPITGAVPAGFSSPGWTAPPVLIELLEVAGFRYVADTVAPASEVIRRAATGARLIAVPTNIVGEPGDIGYLENLRARMLSSNQILADFVRQLRGIRTFGIVYDHPFFAGISQLPTLRAMIRIAQAEGYEICTIQQSIERLPVLPL